MKHRPPNYWVENCGLFLKWHIFQCFILQHNRIQRWKKSEGQAKRKMSKLSKTLPSSWFNLLAFILFTKVLRLSSKGWYLKFNVLLANCSSKLISMSTCLHLNGLFKHKVFELRSSAEVSVYTRGGELYKDLCCEWMRGPVGRSTQAWVCTVTAFNTDFLFVFVPVPGGLLLGRGWICAAVHVWRKTAQDFSQISLERRPIRHTT